MRIAETELGMLNSIGLANPGLERFVGEDLPRLRELGIPLWVSVGGFSRGRLRRDLRAARGRVAAIELNLSCPNVDEAPEGAAEIVAACRASTALPLYAKLSPAAWNIAELARAVELAGADGLSLVNTMRGLALDARRCARARHGHRRLLRAGAEAGRARRRLRLRERGRPADRGHGRRPTGLDALELIAAGASAVALGTILFSDPDAPARIRAELAAEVASRKLGHPLAARRLALGEGRNSSPSVATNRRKSLQMAEKHLA